MPIGAPSYRDPDGWRCDICLRRVYRREDIHGCGRCEYGPWLPAPKADIEKYLKLIKEKAA